jgi:hypothetical protein
MISNGKFNLEMRVLYTEEGGWTWYKQLEKRMTED